MPRNSTGMMQLMANIRSICFLTLECRFLLELSFDLIIKALYCDVEVQAEYQLSCDACASVAEKLPYVMCNRKYMA